MELLLIAGKSCIVYICIVIGFRIFGKKELAQLSMVDLVFILLISNSVQNAMVGDNTSLPGGLAAALGLFLVNYIFKFLNSKFPQVFKTLQGSELMLIYDGKVIEKHLESAMITLPELEAAVREHGVQHIRDVNLAVLEVDGTISVLSNGFQHRTKRIRTKQRLSGQS